MRKITKILVSALLLMSMLLTMMPIVTAADDTATADETTVSYYEGDADAIAAAKAAFIAGTKTAIYTADEFVGFAQASHETNFSGETITLEKDLVFNKGNAVDWITTPPTQYPDWVEVGVSGSTKFAGDFDGKGHTLSGIYFKNIANASGTGFDGVFEALDAGASISNLGIVNSYIESSEQYCSVLLGRAQGNNVTISGCYTNAILKNVRTTGTAVAGGMVGHNGGSNLLIENCVFAGVISDNTSNNVRMGAMLAFEGYYNDTFSTTIRDCVNIGSFDSHNQWAGAFAGTPMKITIERCLNYGYACSSSGKMGLIGGYRGASDGCTYSYAVKDTYLFDGQTLTGSDTDATIGAVLEACKDDISYKTTSLSALYGKLPEIFTGVEEGAETTYFPNWTARSGRLPMPSTAYSYFAEYIDLFDTAPTKFTNDNNIQNVYLTQFYGNSIKSKKTPTKTFAIDSEDELVAFAKASNLGYFPSNASGYEFTLTRDMVLNEGNAEDWAMTAPAFTWTPIANFQGTLDGQGHTISGIYVNNTENYVGLVNVAKAGATISNLGIVNSYYVTTNTSAYMGSFIGRINDLNVNVNGCYSEAILSAAYTGGIVGLITNTVAKTDGNDDTAANISNCAFAGEVTATKGGVGGIVGTSGVYEDTTNWHNFNIVDCINLGSVNATKTDASQGIGGILGFIQGGKVSLTRCINVGDVTTPSTSGNNIYDNALVGQMKNTANYKCTVTDCYIFEDLDQNLFSAQYQKTCTDASYDVNGETDIAKVYSDATVKASYVVAEGIGIKGIDAQTSMKALFDSGNWTARAETLYDEYPLPTVIYENFFKVDLKFVQSTPLDTTNNTYSVRVVARIDSNNYQKVGFKIIVNDSARGSYQLNAEYSEFTYVFKTLKGKTGEGYETITATGDTYYSAISITNLPTTVTSIEVQPYTIGGGADTDTYEYSYGDAMTLNFNSNGEFTGAGN